jgi:hypothetical protein
VGTADTIVRVVLASLAALSKLLTLRVRPPVHSGDLLWDDLGHLSPFDGKLWLGTRPVTVPLLHKLAGFSEWRVVTFQVVCAGIGWTALAVAVSGLLRSRIASFSVFALVLALSQTSGVQGWDLVMRSESASISFLVLGVAGAVATASYRAKHWPSQTAWAAAALGGSFLSAFARDNVAYVLLLFAPFVALGALLAAERPLRLRSWLRQSVAVVVVSLGLGAVALASRANAHAAARFEGPLLNVIFLRVLPDRPKLAWFERRGMPTSAAVLARKGKVMPRGAAGVPALAPFRKWVLEDGYGLYQRYLLTHLGTTSRQAWRNFVATAGDSQERHTRRGSSHFSRAFDAVLVAPLGARPWLSVLVLGVTGLLGLFTRRGGTRLLGALTLTCLVTSLTQAYVAYHGDAMETARHSINVGISLRLAAVAAFPLLLELAIFLRARARRPLRAPSAPSAPS